MKDDGPLITIARVDPWYRRGKANAVTRRRHGENWRLQKDSATASLAPHLRARSSAGDGGPPRLQHTQRCLRHSRWGPGDQKEISPLARNGPAADFRSHASERCRFFEKAPELCTFRGCRRGFLHFTRLRLLNSLNVSGEASRGVSGEASRTLLRSLL